MSNPPTFIGMTSQLIVPPHKFGEWSEIIENSKLDVKIVTKNLQKLEYLIYLILVLVKFNNYINLQ